MPFPSFFFARLGLKLVQLHFLQLLECAGLRALHFLQTQMLNNALSAIGNLPIENHLQLLGGECFYTIILALERSFRNLTRLCFRVGVYFFQQNLFHVLSYQVRRGVHRVPAGFSQDIRHVVVHDFLD